MEFEFYYVQHGNLKRMVYLHMNVNLILADTYSLL